jgi:hypothetical protein
MPAFVQLFGSPADDRNERELAHPEREGGGKAR